MNSPYIHERRRIMDPAKKVKFSQLVRESYSLEEAAEWLDVSIRQFDAPTRESVGNARIALIHVADAMNRGVEIREVLDAAEQFHARLYLVRGRSRQQQIVVELDTLGRERGEPEQRIDPEPEPLPT